VRGPAVPEILDFMGTVLLSRPCSSSRHKLAERAEQEQSARRSEIVARMEGAGLRGYGDSSRTGGANLSCASLTLQLELRSAWAPHGFLGRPFAVNVFARANKKGGLALSFLGIAIPL
jgi:hypothetical protein